jgi:hypothetical protein
MRRRCRSRPGRRASLGATSAAARAPTRRPAPGAGPGALLSGWPRRGPVLEARRCSRRAAVRSLLSDHRGIRVRCHRRHRRSLSARDSNAPGLPLQLVSSPEYKTGFSSSGLWKVAEGFQNPGSGRRRRRCVGSGFTRARVPDRSRLRNSVAVGRGSTSSLRLRSAAGGGSIGACSFRSPISPSRLCCDCWSVAGAASSPRTSSCSCCDINWPYFAGASDARGCGQPIVRCLQR